MDSVTVAWAGIASAWVAGATGSLHCAVMCGPLACAAIGGTNARTEATLAWQVGRVTAYTTVGVLLGTMGRVVSEVVLTSIQPWLPWVMAAGLLITGFDLTKRLPAIPGLRHIAKALSRRASTQHGTSRAFLLGAATAFLPCGLLFGMFLAAMATGTPWGGAVLLASFALGGVPALLAVQWGSGRIPLSPRLATFLRRGVPLLAAVVLIARAWLQRQSPAVCG